jgi:hypothetical protein
MGAQPLTLRKAWEVYDNWLADPRVAFYPEPRGIDTAFRQMTEPHAARTASKWVGDCWLLAYAREIQATLVTFDRRLFEFARKHACLVTIPNPQEPPAKLLRQNKLLNLVHQARPLLRVEQILRVGRAVQNHELLRFWRLRVVL